MQLLSAPKICTTLTVYFSLQTGMAQQIGIGTPTPAASAILDVSSTTRGLLPPRLTAAQRNAIASPANGLIVFDTDSAALMLRSAGGWRRLTTTATPGGFWGTNDGHIFNLNTGNVGIGTSTPAARLHVADSSVLFSGLITNTLTPGIAPPVEGPGIRMLWYPHKAAFRAGFAGFNTWDRDNIGTHSFAGGQATLAKGRSSTAFGLATESIGDFSTATGIFTRSRAFGSIAVGAYNNSEDNPNPVTAAPEDRIFQIGNGTADNARNNALTVLRNGNVGIGTITPQVPLQFAPTASGKKMSLYRGATGDAGFSVWPNEMRMHSDQSATAITFGFDNLSNGFTERFRITPTGDLRMASDRQSIQFVSNGTNENEAMMKMFEQGTQNPTRMVFAHSNAFKGWGLEYNDTTDQFNFKSSQTAKVSIELASGFVGINDSFPNYHLDVKGRIRLQGLGDEANSAGIWYSRIANKNEAFFAGMRNDSSWGIFSNSPQGRGWSFNMNDRTGFIGLGNFNANAPLHLNNELQNRKIILYENANNNHQYYGFGINSGVLRYQTDAQNADHVFYAAVDGNSSAELMRIKGKGNVGIGTSNPSRKLSVNGNLVLNLETETYIDGVDEFTNYYYPRIWFYVGNNYLGGLGYLNENVFSLWNNADNNLFIVDVANKNMGIHETSPVHRLDVGGRIFLKSDWENGESAGLWLGNSTRVKNAFIGNRSDTETGLYGNTGSPNWRFYVNTTNGNAWLQGSLTQNSDETLKKNIEPIANASHLLQQLHGYRYQWKDANADADKQLGLLAQEVQKVLPELVKEGDNGKLGVNYSGLIPVLLEALKELQAKNEVQKEKLLQQSEAIANQQKRIEALEHAIQHMVKSKL